MLGDSLQKGLLEAAVRMLHGLLEIWRVGWQWGALRGRDACNLMQLGGALMDRKVVKGVVDAVLHCAT